MLGAVMGSVLTFLVSTQKGRAILKELSDKGLDALDEIKNLKELEIIEEEVAAMDIGPNQVAQNQTPEPAVHPEETTTELKTTHHPIRKFFRGVKRK